MKNENSHMVFNFYEHFITTDYLNKTILIHIGWNIEIENYHIAIYRQISRDYWKMILKKTILDSKETDLFHVLKAIEKKKYHARCSKQKRKIGIFFQYAFFE